MSNGSFLLGIRNLFCEISAIGAGFSLETFSHSVVGVWIDSVVGNNGVSDKFSDIVSVESFSTGLLKSIVVFFIFFVESDLSL
jgi:hypothetical protein